MKAFAKGLSMSHEILTHDGWRTFNQLKMSDKIASLKDNEELVYEQPLSLSFFPDYSGRMYQIKNRQIDLDVTENHTMYCSKGSWNEKNFNLLPAVCISGDQVTYKRNAIWKAEKYQFTLPGTYLEETRTPLPDKKVNMNTWIQLFGVWMIGNCFGDENNFRVTIHQHIPQSKQIAIDSIQNLGFDHSIRNNGIDVYNKQLFSYLTSISRPRVSFPPWVWKLSSKQCQLLLESMIIGEEGMTICSDCIMFQAPSWNIASDIMRLCLHIGWSSVIMRENVVRIHKDISKGEFEVNRPEDLQLERLYDNYHGSIFCIQMPSGLFYVRKNGKGVWTGCS
jgi:hypothetical protein